MGLKTSIRNGSSLIFVFLLILSQIISVGFFSSASDSQYITSTICGNSAYPFEPYEPNVHGIGLYDLLVVDDLVIAEFEDGSDFLNISTPSDPKEAIICSDFAHPSRAFTNYGDTILFGSSESYRRNYSIMKIDLASNTTECTEIAFWSNTRPCIMSLTNDTLFVFAENIYDNHVFIEFMIFNATNINVLTLLGNTTLTGSNVRSSFIVHENFVYFISYARNLFVYQINSTYQLTFIKEYSFAQLESVYFHENYLFTCNDLGFQVYDYSNPASLSLVTHYNISSAQYIRVRNDIAYLTTSDSFTTLDLSDIMDIQALDQYIPSNREFVELWKIDLNGNLAIILTEILWYLDYGGDYGGYLYIFDISSPNKIIRLYPDRIPLLDNWDKFILRFILLVIVLPIVTVLSVILIFVRVYWKKNNKRRMIHLLKLELFYFITIIN